ncbi:Exopolysaccharide production protein exoZ [Pseudomonas amygdali pv. morsprunorum]|nr:Exopolysaccharide production protein exoZ [Pseudomonas amygdali pv. morsprunorum]
MQLACNGQREIYYWNMDGVFQPRGDRYFQYLDPLAAISCFQIRLRCYSRSMIGIQSMRIVSLQYLRGFAALLVVVSHNSFLLEGNWVERIPGALGVDIFFIISGFIMTFITYQATERPTSFIVKRLFRIWPVFFIVWLVSYLFVYPERPLHPMVCTLYFCLQEYSLPAPSFGFSALGPPWTLSYEIMFYLIFTISMSISYRYRSYVCALVFLMSSVGFQLYYNGQVDFSSQSTPAITVIHWWQAWIKLISNTITFEFIFGMMLAELTLANTLPLLKPFGRKSIRLVLLLAIIGAGIIGPQPFGISGGFWLAATIMTAVIMLSYRSESGSNRTLIFLGDISYSLYLVHYSVMVFLTQLMSKNASPTEKSGVFILSITASIVMASVMFKWIEKPSIKVGKKVASALSARLKPYTN